MKKLIFSLLLIVPTLCFADDLITKVIALNYVNAQQILPALEPLVKKGESVSVANNKIVVNVSPDTLTKIRKIIQGIDIPPVVFNISVHQGDAGWLDQSQDSIVYGTSSHSDKGDNQTVQVASGDVARVSTGSNVPVVSSVGCGCFFGPSVSFDRVTVDQGIYLLPELQGSRVKLVVRRVNSQVDRFNNQAINNQNLDTTTYLPTNKWVKLGSSSSTPNDTHGDTVSYSAGASFKDKGTLFVKIEVIK